MVKTIGAYSIEELAKIIRAYSTEGWQESLGFIQQALARNIGIFPTVRSGKKYWGLLNRESG